MNTPNTTPNNDSNLLDQILATPSNEEPTASSATTAAPSTPPPPPKPKPPKKPLSPGEFLKIIGAILLVALIFFGVFLSYIVFNPGQAQFFISFGINPGDIASLLQKLVHGIFGFITFIVSIIWVIFLFRAILTKKEFKKKKTISVILSFFFGMLLFSGITLWAFLIEQIGASDYENPNGGVVVYDNDRLLSEKFKNSSEITRFENLIGPVTLKYDLKSDANYAAKSMNIESYEIDFDGDGKSDKVGTNPRDDQSLIYTYDQVGSYKPQGVYIGTDKVTRKEKTMPILFPSINVVGVVKIKMPRPPREKRMVFDASGLSSLGKVEWYGEKDSNTPLGTDYIYAEEVTKEEKILCMVIVNNIKNSGNCDKLFVVKSQSNSPIEGKIIFERDAANPLDYTFKIDGLKVKNGDIENYKWVVNNTVIASNEETCEYTFLEYGDAKVSVTLTDTVGNSVELSDSFAIAKPLKLIRARGEQSYLKILNEAGESVINNVYDNELKAYMIKDVSVPTTLTFDANDVKVGNQGYKLKSVEWDFDGDGKFDKTGIKVDHEFLEENRYDIKVRYSFISELDGNSQTLEENVVIEAERMAISAVLKVDQESDYAPATVTFDASASQVKDGTISKFIFDFGENKVPLEWDAVQTYRYNLPGEYSVTLTVVKSDGTKDVTTKKIIVKSAPKKLIINSSVSSGFVGKSIDFDTQWTIGQIESYLWDFGDNTTSSDTIASHSYSEPGTYTVKLSVTYADGTIRQEEKEITIQ